MTGDPTIPFREDCAACEAELTEEEIGFDLCSRCEEIFYEDLNGTPLPIDDEEEEGAGYS